MTFALRFSFLLCAISGPLTGAWSLGKITVQDNSCPKDWTRLDCNCYIYQSDARSFADAESVCNILGGNLVSIHNDLENAFVLELAKAAGNTAEFWIGLHDNILGDDYIWTDGSINDFQGFDGTPTSSTENCVEYDVPSEFWQTEDCPEENAYVCIRDVFH
ncbi:galactose-specific lectin nattectin [Syngnathus scovelli]|uniref:galactose-specific lectin nattectin n=1 Tax=Syngnathus scovelli TaxID=161590 RepID=UPI00210F4B12|nr:galactose-specific lectin nattectin [Syngnathus scovelli]